MSIENVNEFFPEMCERIHAPKRKVRAFRRANDLLRLIGQRDFHPGRPRPQAEIVNATIVDGHGMSTCLKPTETHGNTTA
ncbi:MAG: hypothetical protein ACRYHA_34210 [Janthinobacterium lividum]